MMVRWVKNVLVLRRHFAPNDLTSAGKFCKLVPLETILCTMYIILKALLISCLSCYLCHSFTKVTLAVIVSVRVGPCGN
jgi:hypothetical protein